MRFDSVSSCEEIIWDMRLSEQVRAADRATLLRLFDGYPPFDEATAEENNIQVNRNNLTGPNVICQAGLQWNNAHLKSRNFFTAKPDSGPGHKRDEWAESVTRCANRILKRSPAMTGDIKATGKNTLMFGIGASNWPNRRGIIPKPVPVGSLMIPSETEIEDLNDSLSYFAIFREYNAEQLYDMTHGPHVDPGWNMPLVQAQWEYIKDELRKSPNSLAYQYMPERIEQLEKQDKGYLGTDAAPTCDVWDFYFREAENGKGWYRRIIVDWYVGDQMATYKQNGTRPASRNRVGEKEAFLYSSGKRKYADSLGQILHCVTGDCSPYAPVKYHALRGLAWMLWGVCDTDNRLDCKFTEAVFEQLMWFFQTAGNQDLIRLKKANFEHMGVIPQGIKFLTAQERFTPNGALVQMAFNRARQQISDVATSYTRDYDKGEDARTATETMAIVNASQAMASGVMASSYQQMLFKYREILRRLMLKNSNDPMAREFRKSVLHDGVPEDMLSVEKWDVQPEEVLGGGNKTIQMAQVQFLNTMRKNLPPAGQRLVDHMSFEVATDRPDLAEEAAPLGEDKPISTSMANAQDATMRILHGLPYALPKDAIYEDYAKVWIHDLSMEIQRINGRGGVAMPDELNGLMNLGKHIGLVLAEMAKNTDEKPRVKEYMDAFGKLMNHVKGFEQRLQQIMKKQQQGNGAGAPAGPDPKDAAKAQAMIIQAQTKAQIAANSAQQRTAQKQQQWELGERRKDMELASNIKRKGIETRHELMSNRLRALVE